MKNNLNKILLFSFFLLASFSCRKEIVIDKTGNDNKGFSKTSKVANLIREVSLHDGSFDNIIDHANSFSIKMPYTVIVNGQTINIQTEDDLQTVEDILDASDSDTDSIQIVFPITIILPDYTEVVIHNQNELNTYLDQSTGENEEDDDIECVDFIYPVIFHVYDTVTEQTLTVSISNDEEMEEFIDSLDSDTLASIEFPVHLKLSDGTEVTASNVSELENIIDDAKDDCDEDDDNDYNDDDCNNCTSTQINTVLTSCSNWTVEELERNDTDLGDNYTTYSFHFASNGTITAEDGAVTYIGTWSSSGTGSDIILSIAIPALPDLSGNWHLLEIKDNGNEKELKLEIDDDNKLKFLSTCN